MQNILIQVKKTYSDQKPTYESFWNQVKSIDPKSVDYINHLPELSSNGDYSRNIMMLEPLECVLLYWPAKAESAIHYHEGFWGYVLVLDGCCDNVEFTLANGALTETRTTRALQGGILNEPDGTVHKIVNPSKTDTLVTLHFYYPALEDLNNLVLYSEDGKKGVLNELAKTASFNEPKEHFKLLEDNAFDYVPFNKSSKAKSHHIYPILPKPGKALINEMISDYYSEQAEQYDLFDFNHPTRKNYTKKINALIAAELDKQPNMNRMLTLACGTGRRAVNIKSETKHDYEITGIDLCAEMCEIAETRGLSTIPADWLEAKLGNQQFDSCTFLYAFGHISNSEERKIALSKIANHLTPGGSLFLDVFNIHDKHEWGANAMHTFDQMDLVHWGYEKGDVFYKKTNANEVAFLHYFDEADLVKLLEETGFEIEYIKHIGYVYRSGDILDNKDEGSLFVKAVKK